MNNTKKSIIVLFCASIIMMSSCTTRRNATGCPNWSKAKQEQSNKKNV